MDAAPSEPKSADEGSPGPTGRGAAWVVAKLKPSTPELTAYAITTFVSSIGTSMYLTVSVVYFVRSLHLNVGFVGAGLTIAALVGLATSVPAGRLVDQRGAKPVLITLYVVEAVLFALFHLVNGPVEFLGIVTMISVVANGSYPANRALLSELVG